MGRQADDTPSRRGENDLVTMKNPDEYKDFIEPMPLAVLVRGRIPFTFQGEAAPEWKKK